jgi:hypothetical protein
MFLVFLKSSSGQWVDARYVRSFSVDYSQRTENSRSMGLPQSGPSLLAWAATSRRSSLKSCMKLGRPLRLH